VQNRLQGSQRRRYAKANIERNTARWACLDILAAAEWNQAGQVLPGVYPGSGLSVTGIGETCGVVRCAPPVESAVDAECGAVVGCDIEVGCGAAVEDDECCMEVGYGAGSQPPGPGAKDGAEEEETEVRSEAVVVGVAAEVMPVVEEG
jgi:hypothetical protein